ncbi:hypothetical protein [Luteimicrobium sp. DT211]|uniref:hypothetical protein n=1 Tax=Luteimicrobium sp. DT211 TaxID=3393412 RepID=UPI003CE71643
MPQASAPSRPAGDLGAYRRRIGRLTEAARGSHGARPVGFVVTRVVTHWDTVGPHLAPSHVNPVERLEWRVHFDDALPELYCDDAAVRGTSALDALRDGRLRLGERHLHVAWLDGAEADDVWSALGW